MIRHPLSPVTVLGCFLIVGAACAGEPVKVDRQPLLAQVKRFRKPSTCSAARCPPRTRTPWPAPARNPTTPRRSPPFRPSSTGIAWPTSALRMTKP